MGACGPLFYYLSACFRDIYTDFSCLLRSCLCLWLDQTIVVFIRARIRVLRAVYGPASLNQIQARAHLVEYVSDRLRFFDERTKLLRIAEDLLEAGGFCLEVTLGYCCYSRLTDTFIWVHISGTLQCVLVVGVLPDLISPIGFGGVECLIRSFYKFLWLVGVGGDDRRAADTGCNIGRNSGVGMGDSKMENI